MGPTCELDPELEEAFAGKVGVTTVVVTRVEVNTWPALLVPLENGLGQKKKKGRKGKGQGCTDTERLVDMAVETRGGAEEEASVGADGEAEAVAEVLLEPDWVGILAVPEDPLPPPLEGVFEGVESEEGGVEEFPGEVGSEGVGDEGGDEVGEVGGELEGGEDVGVGVVGGEVTGAEEPG